MVRCCSPFVRYGHGVAHNRSSGAGQAYRGVFLGLSRRFGGESVRGLVPFYACMSGDPLKRDGVSLVSQLLQQSPYIPGGHRCLGRRALLQQQEAGSGVCK